jgi:hypothetical protein
VVLALAGALPARGAAPRLPFPQHLTYGPGTLLPNHRGRAQLDGDVVAAYGRWKALYLAQAGQEADGQPRYRIKFSVAVGAKTVSEGQGYGMVITAFLAGADPAAQTIFDGLWEFFNDHRSPIEPRLMTWQVFADESVDPDSNDSAFDGDCDIAFALLLADRQWGSGGRIDYRHEAESVLSGLLAAAIGPQSRLPLLGDWVDPQGTLYNQRTVRSSDFMPDHFRAFAAVTGNAEWNAVTAAVTGQIDKLQEQFSQATGLLPDFIVPRSVSDPSPKPAPASFLEGPHDGDYFYNAGRDPWRLGLDALLHSSPQTLARVRKMAAWARAAAAGDPRRLAAGYRLNGTPLPDSAYVSTFFLAPFGVAAMSTPGQQAWLNGLYDAVRGETQGYYEDSVTLLCLLVMTGNWWDPGLAAGPADCGGPAQLCLGQDRYRVEAAWRTGAAAGNGTAVALTADTGYFWFFNQANVEVVVKALDGCTGNDHIWVFASGLTNVAVDLTVTDLRSGAQRFYHNPPSTPFQPIQDTAAFACSP